MKSWKRESPGTEDRIVEGSSYWICKRKNIKQERYQRVIMNEAQKIPANGGETTGEWQKQHWQGWRAVQPDDLEMKAGILQMKERECFRCSNEEQGGHLTYFQPPWLQKSMRGKAATWKGFSGISVMEENQISTRAESGREVSKRS